MNQVSVIGAGSWGMSLAILLAKKGHTIRIWDRNPEILSEIKANHRNPRYLTEFAMPESIVPFFDLQEAVFDSQMIVLVVPCNAIRSVTQEMIPALSPGASLISAAKGLESSTGLRVSQVLKEILPEPLHRGIVVLSGPNLAVELAREIPTTSVVAAEDPLVAQAAQDLFMTSTFRVYTNTDINGVELGGALKNIIAIGAGISDGLGYGDNTKASLMTRGLAEMVRLGVALGSREETFYGLSGVGDLITTCASTLSRNRRVGYELGKGHQLPEILRKMGQVAEGVPTTRAACLLAAEKGVEMPIANAVYDVIFNARAPLETVQELMVRESKSELMDFGQQ
jgi:glycerol-3-phosphate dehydrogenase (NAD(P)+)